MKTTPDQRPFKTKVKAIALAISLLGGAVADVSATVIQKPSVGNYYQDAAIISGAGNTKLMVSNWPVGLLPGGMTIRSANGKNSTTNVNSYLTPVTNISYRQLDSNIFIPQKTMGGIPIGFYKDASGNWFSGLMNQYVISFYLSGEVGKSQWMPVSAENKVILDKAKDFIAGRFIITTDKKLYGVSFNSAANGKINLSEFPIDLVAYGFANNKLYVADSLGDVHEINTSDLTKQTLTNVGASDPESVVKNIVVINTRSYYMKDKNIYHIMASGIDTQPSKIVATNSEASIESYTFSHGPNNLVVAWPDGSIIPAGSGGGKHSSSDFLHHNIDRMMVSKIDLAGGGSPLAYTSDLGNGKIAYTIYDTASGGNTAYVGVFEAPVDPGTKLLDAQFVSSVLDPAKALKTVDGVETNYLAYKKFAQLTLHWSNDRFSIAFFNKADYTVATLDNTPLITKPAYSPYDIDADATIAQKRLIDTSGKILKLKIGYEIVTSSFVSNLMPETLSSYVFSGVARRVDYVNSNAFLPMKLPSDQLVAAGIDLSPVFKYDYSINLPSITNISSKSIPSQSITVTAPSGDEAMIDYGRVVGLDEKGQPYFRGYLSKEPNTGWKSQANKINIDYKDEFVGKIVASKGKFNDKVLVTWEGSTEKYLVQPKVCKKSGADCANLGAEIEVTGQSYEHTADAGIPSDVQSAADKRIFYAITPIKDDIIYYTNTDTAPGKIRGSAVTSNGGYLSSPPTATSATLDVPSNTAGAQLSPSVTDPDDDNTYTYEIVTPATNGTAYIGTDGQIKYTVGNYSGADTFTYRVTDTQGDSVEGTATVTVTCPAPEIISFSAPTSVKAYQDNVFSFKYRANLCNGDSINYKLAAIAPGLGDDDYVKEGQLQSKPNDSTGMVSFANPNPGDYALTLELTATSGENTATKILNTTVAPLSEPKLTLSASNPTEDDLITASVAFGGKDCPMYETESDAKAYRGCYVEWSHPMTGTALTVDKDKATLTGYADQGGPYLVQAEIFKANSIGELQSVGTVSDLLFVTPGTPSTFTKPSFAGSLRQYLDLVDFTITQKTGNTCTLTTSTVAAEAAAQKGKRVCLVEFLQLPEGVVAAADGTARFTGRIKNLSNPTISYKISKYYIGQAPIMMQEETLTLDVLASTLTGEVVTDRAAYAKGLQTATVTGTSTCPITVIESEAKQSYGQNALTCLGVWKTLPTWLTPSDAKMMATGTAPATIGSNAVDYDLFMVDKAGNRTLLGTYAGKVDVVDLSPIAVSVTPANGNLLGGTDGPVYLMDNKGKIGSYTVDGGEFATVRAKLMLGTQPALIKTGLKDGQSNELSLGALTTTPFIAQDLLIEVQYEGINDASQTRTETVKVAALPPTNLAAMVETPLQSLVTTKEFSLKGKMGVGMGGSALSYAAVSHGTWNAYLAVQNEFGLSPLTNPQAVSDTGQVVFEGLTYTQVADRKIVMVAEPILPTGTSLETPVQVISPVAKMTFVSGEALNGTVLADKEKGFAPLTTRFDLQIPSEMSTSLGNVTWQTSTDGGTTWATMQGVSGKSVSYKFVSGGVYLVRAKLLNKNSQAESFSTVLPIDVKQSLKMTLVGETAQLPGRPVTLNLTASTPEGGTVAYDTEWLIESSLGEVTTQQNKDTITLNTEEQVTYDVTVRAKPKTMTADDPEAWTSLKKQVKFAWPEPTKVSVSGPKRLEVGTPALFKATVKAPPSETMVMKGEWVLPEGVTTADPLTGLSVNLTLDPAVFNEGDTANIGYRAWIDGAKTQSETLYNFATMVTEYQFAQFALSKKGELVAAPAYVSLVVVAATPDERKKIGKQKITYTWTLPESTSVKAKAKGASLELWADVAGTYPIKVTVSDEVGNKQELDYVLTAVESEPYVIDLKSGLGQKYNRNPMRFSIKPLLSGGHPKDRIAEYELFLDGTSLGKSVRVPNAVTVPTAGDHKLKLSVKSAMGMTAEKEIDLSVNQNKAPECQELNVAWDRTGKAAYVTARCVDQDGKIKGLNWYINETLQTTNGRNRIIVSSDQIGSSAEIKLEAIDDSGDVTRKQTTLMPTSTARIK